MAPLLTKFGYWPLGMVYLSKLDPCLKWLLGRENKVQCNWFRFLKKKTKQNPFSLGLCGYCLESYMVAKKLVKCKELQQKKGDELVRLFLGY